MSTPRDAGLTDAELEALRVAWRGPWGDDMVPAAPPRLVGVVERIVVERLRDMAAELTAMRSHSSAGCDCDNCAPWAGAAAVVHERADRLARQWHPALSRWIYPDEPECDRLHGAGGHIQSVTPGTAVCACQEEKR